MAAADPEDDGRHKHKLCGGGGGGGQPGFAGLPLPAPVIDEDRHRAPDCQQAQHHSKHHQQAGAALLQSKTVAVAKLPQVICLRHIEYQQEEAAERDRRSCCVQGVDVIASVSPACSLTPEEGRGAQQRGGGTKTPKTAPGSTAGAYGGGQAEWATADDEGAPAVGRPEVWPAHCRVDPDQPPKPAHGTHVWRRAVSDVTHGRC